MATNLLRSWLRVRGTAPALTRFYNQKSVVVYDPFTNARRKDKETYKQLVKVFEGRDIRRRGHVEFIYAALAQMKEFGVHKDLESYKSLLDVFPKGKFIPSNIFQAEFMHFPKQQQCAVDLLEQMEDNGVMPDSEMQDILLNIFGRRGIPLRKYWRMMYWMPKFRHLSPWPLPDELPNDSLDLAKLAIQRITSVDPDTQVDVLQCEEIEASLDKTWIVSGQSPAQRVLLAEQPSDEPLVVRGPFLLHLKDQTVSYFTLIGKTKQERQENTDDVDDVSNIKVPPLFPAFGATKLPSVKCTIHEQDDGTICAICATGTSSRDSLLSWIRLLARHGNPLLETLPVIFTLLAPSTDIAVPEAEERTERLESKEKVEA